MTAPFIKLLKVWLVLLTVWLLLLTLALVVFVVFSASAFSQDPKAMFTRWQGEHLNIGTRSGRFFITHLENVTQQSFAELPKPLLVVSSGGVLIPHSDLAKLTWILSPDTHDSAFPLATNQTVAPPPVGSRIEALYLVPASAKFQTK